MLTQLRTLLARSRALYGERLLTTITTVILALLLFVFAPLGCRAGLIAFEAMGFAATLILNRQHGRDVGKPHGAGTMLFALPQRR